VKRSEKGADTPAPFLLPNLPDRAHRQSPLHMLVETDETGRRYGDEKDALYSSKQPETQAKFHTTLPKSFAHCLLS
jgi:hypothetical protein